MKNLVLVALTLLMSGGWSVGQATESRPSSTAAELIKQLDSDSFETRNRAMDDLRALGEAARAELEAAKASKSLEVRTRADHLLGELNARKSPAPRAGQGVQKLRPADGTDTENEHENATPPAPQRERVTPPRFEDFRDPNAYFDALRQYMDQSFRDVMRNHGGLIPPPTVLPPSGGQDPHQTFEIPPGGHRIRHSVTRTVNGETVRFTSGVEGVDLQVSTVGETGEKQVETYSAQDLDEFKKKYPEVWDKFAPSGIFDGGSGFTVRVLPGGPPLRADPPKRPPRGGAVEPLRPERLAPVPEIAGPRLGVEIAPIPPILDAQLKLNGRGVAIEMVEPGTIAARLGLRQHDVLLEIDGQDVRSADDIRHQMVDGAQNAQISVKVMREGSLQELTASRAKAR